MSGNPTRSPAIDIPSMHLPLIAIGG